jgi:hypothetical protein
MAYWREALSLIVAVRKISQSLMCETTDSRHGSKGPQASGFKVMFKIRTSLILTQRIRFQRSKRYKYLIGIRADTWKCTQEKDDKSIFLETLCM